jgi:hypothetical protein
LLVFEAMVYRRQEHYRRQHQRASLPAQAVCAEGTRQQLDQDLLSCLKYFINFFFYKFGLEVRPGVWCLALSQQGSLLPGAWGAAPRPWTVRAATTSREAG